MSTMAGSGASLIMDDRGDIDIDTLSRHNGSVDELQLAALLGKSLLKKNSELEQSLRRLQEYAEETMSTNQILNRQLYELKSSLQFSNKSCEQLEQKTEELERSNIRLQKLCDMQQTLLTQKTSTLADLQKDYSQLKYQHEQLQAKVVVKTTNTAGCDASKEHSKSGSKQKETGDNANEAELQSTLEELTLKVQNVSFQKQKLEQDLEDVVNENQSLVKALERAETDMTELQTKLRGYEENSLELTSPKSGDQLYSVTPMIPPADDLFFFQPQYHSCKSPTKSTNEHVAGVSLFNELDVQYKTLQQRYQELVEDCTCSASLFHKKWLPSKCEDFPASLQENCVLTETPFKELFDEVFATLKQTTFVADKLIERKNNK